MDLSKKRASKGMTQAELAKALGISRAAYTNIENGKRQPSVKVAKKLAVILDFPWAQLFEDTKAG